MMSSINACFIMLVLSSIGVIAKTKVFNDSAGLEEDFYSYSGPINFYYFVQRWPASYCDWSRTRGACCHPKTGNLRDRFFIHGLWPQYWPTGNGDKFPQDCCSSPEFSSSYTSCDRKFDSSQISNLKEVEQYWPSIKYGGAPKCSTLTQHQFWKHEWEKHGTCSVHLNVGSYFQKTLSLRKHIHLLMALKAAGIRPNGNEYSLRAIEYAIHGHTGGRPRVQCNRNSEGKRQLYEVYVCVGRDASTVIDCPKYGNCPPRVVFPRFGG